MGAGANIIYWFAYALGTSLLPFPIAALVIRGRHKAKLPWGKGLALFGLTIVLVGIIYLVALTANPNVLSSTASPGVQLIFDILVPFVVSLLVLGFIWRPDRPVRAKSALAAGNAPSRQLRLNTRQKRVWFLVFIAGILICGATYIIYTSQYSYPQFDDALFNWPNRFGGYKLFILGGLVASIVGLFMSVLYDYLVAPLIRWVKSAPSNAP